MRAHKYLVANALAAVVWALGIGLATFVAGPSVAEIFGDLGAAGTVVVALTAIAAALADRYRRSHRHQAP